MFDFGRITGPEDSKQENFSSLCTCLVMRQFSGAKPVEGRGGDEGIDTFVGDFAGSLRVFQHKYFLSGLKSSQRRQVLSSLDQVTKHHDVTAWTLMLPCDLTPAELRWFDTVRTGHPNIDIDWWGKTKLLSLLAQNRDLAAIFQPAPALNVILLGKEKSADELTLEAIARKLTELGYESSALLASAVHEKITSAPPSSALRILLWGPCETGGALYNKRAEIRNSLEKLGHKVWFSEDLSSASAHAVGGLNVTLEEYQHVNSVDYVVCLMSSPGTIGEVHDFAKKRHFACKMMICVDRQHEDGYSAKGVLRIFEGLNGKLDWFRVPEDLTECHLATRVHQQIQKTAEAKQWELLEKGP